MSKFGWLVVLLLVNLQLSAQAPGKIQVDVNKIPLNQVLLDLREKYGFQFAFDSDLLSKYPVSVKRSFQLEEETLKYLIRNLPFTVEKSGDVFLIIPQEEQKEGPGITRISGQVLEAVTNEPLPFSYILINRKPIQSDQEGNFNFLASAGGGYNLQISHLGYYIYDTLLTNSIEKKFYLMPQIERISEVKVLSNPIEKSTLIGDRAGRMKINHQIAPILPGHGDNSVFTLLRLMPGILAAGEQSNDLLIWGAYESHSKIQFDGFTLFGLKNFNDNISVVNPFMVKNIEVMKGGYGVEYGDRVGGIVYITGKDGSLQKPTFTFNINSTTINSMVQLPLSAKSSMMAAYRQTYYQLYDPTTLSLFTNSQNDTGSGQGGNKNEPSGVGLAVTPDYTFRDANLKYSYRCNNGRNFVLSLYGGGDQFMYDINREITRFQVTRNEKEENQQYGGSARFEQVWKNGNATTFTLAYSAFNQQLSEENRVENTRTGYVRSSKIDDSENTVDEISLKAGHTLNFKAGQKLILTVGTANNHVNLSRFIDTETTLDLDNYLSRLFVFAQDELPVGDFLNVKAGVRITYATELEQWFTDPRASISVKLSDKFKLNAAWGLYHQYTAKTTLLDSAYNFNTFWVNADKNDIPVLSAEHYVAGLSFSDKGFTASAEAYYKTTDGLTRYFRGNKMFDPRFYEGNARSYGLDFFLKKEYKRHMAWVSYTLSQSEEHFPFYLKDYYQPAPQHQKHELKVAAILNYKSFYFSANYVYGSGFKRFNIETENGVKLNQPYNRADASLVYKFKPGKVKAEAGISVLNVFNTNNIKYSNLRLTTTDDLSLVGVYADAMPFTPALFFKVEF